MSKKLIATFAISGVVAASVGAGIGAGAYLLLQDGNIYKAIYDHNQDGDLVLKFQLSSSKVGKFANSKAIAVFKNSKGVSSEIEILIDKDGKTFIDTKELRNKDFYNLEKIISINKTTILSNEELMKELKEKIVKPTPFSRTFDKTNKEYLVANLDKSNIFQDVVGIFRDSEYQKYEIPAKGDKNGQVWFDTSLLPEDKVFVLEAIVKNDDGKLQKVANLDDVSLARKLVNKTKVVNHDFNNDGDVVLNLKTTHKNLEIGSPLNAILKNKNGEEFVVSAKIDENGLVHFDTSSLEPTNVYNLDRIEDGDQPNRVIFANNELNDFLKEDIYVPFKTDLTLDEKGEEPIFKVSTYKDLQGKVLKAIFKDENDKTFEVPGFVDENGEAVFNVKDLPFGSLYYLDDVLLNENNQKIINISKQLDKEQLKINKLNSDPLNDNNAKNTHNKNGDLILNAKVEKKYANEQAYGVFVDQKGNEHKIAGIIDEEGNVQFDTASLPNNEIYKLEKIISVNDEEKTLIKKAELSPNQREKFKKPGVSTFRVGENDLELLFKEPGLKDKEITIKFKNSNGVIIPLKGSITSDGTLIIPTTDNSVFPQGDIYTMDSIVDSDGNKVINLDNIDSNNKIINKLIKENETNPQYQWIYDKYNQLLITLVKNDPNDPIEPRNPQKNWVRKDPIEADAIFRDEKNKLHHIPIWIDEANDTLIPTLDLPNFNKYQLVKINSKDGSQTLVENADLPKAVKKWFNKPLFTTKVEPNNDSIVDWNDPELANTKVIGSFMNGDYKIFEAQGIIDLTGKVVFKTGDDNQFPKNDVYVLSKVVDATSQKDLAPNAILVVNKNLIGTRTNDTISIPLPENFKTLTEVDIILKDQDKNTIVAKAKVEDNKIVFDANSKALNTNVIYDIDKIVDSSTIPNTLIWEANDLKDEVKKINNNKLTGRKISVIDANASLINGLDARVELSLKDINHLTNEKHLALTLVSATDPNDKHKWIAPVDSKSKTVAFDFANLNPNTTYKVLKFNFEPKDETIAIEDAKLSSITITTLGDKQENRAAWGAVSQDSKETNFTSAKIAVEIVNPNIDTLTVKFVEIKKDGSESEVKEAILNKDANNNFVATIDSLTANTLYKVVDVVDNNESLFRKRESSNSLFGTKANPVELTFVELDNANVYGYFNAKLALKYIDQDDKLEVGNPVVLEYRKEGSSLSYKANGYVSENKTILVDVNDLLPEKTYEMIGMESVNQNLGTNEKISFKFANNSEKQFQALSDELINQLLFARFKNKKKGYTKNEEIVISTKFGRSKFVDLANKKVILVYQNANGHEVKTEVSTFPERSTLELEFRIAANKVKGNSQYFLSQVIYGDNDADLESQPPKNLDIHPEVKSSFKVNPSSDVEIKNVEEVLSVTNNTNNNAIISLNLKDEDDVISEGDRFQVIVAPTNDKENPIVLLGFAKVDANSNEKHIEVILDRNIKFKKEYKLLNVEALNIAKQTILPIANKNTDQIIYDSTKENTKPYKFSKNLSISNIKPLVIPSSDTTKASVNLTYEFEQNNINLEGYLFKAKISYDNDKKEIESNIFEVNGEGKLIINIPDLISNREYKIKKLWVSNNREEFANKTAEEIQLKNGVNEQTFNVEPSATKVLLVSDIISGYDEASMKVKITTHDEIDLENKKVIVKVNKKSDDSEVIAAQEAKIQKVENNFIIDLAFANLDSNTQFVLKEIKLETKPAETLKNINDNDENKIIIDPEISWTTKSKEVNLVKISDSNVDSASGNANVSVTLQILGKGFDNNKIKLVYTSELATTKTIESTPIVLDKANPEHSFTVNIAEKDVIYKLSKILYGADNAITEEVNMSNILNTLVNKSAEVEFTFDKDVNQTIDETSATLEIEFNDTNTEKVIKADSIINVQYRRKAEGTNIQEEWKIAQATVDVASNKISLALTGLMSNEAYELGNISVTKPDNKDLAPQAILKGKDSKAKEFRTLMASQDTVEAVSSTYNVANNNATINATINGSRLEKWNNKKIKAIYIDNNGDEYSSEEKLVDTTTNISDGKLKLDITLGSLKKNRNYRLVKFVNVETSEEIEILNGVSDSFDATPGLTKAILKENTSIDKKKKTATFELKVTTEDSFELANLPVSITIAKSNDLSSTITETFNISADGIVNVTFNNLVSNTDYKITNMKFLTKPQVVFKNTNNDANNSTILVNNPEITWKTEAGTITLTSIKHQEVNKSLDKVNVNVNLDIQGSEFDEQNIKLVYIDPRNKEISSEVLKLNSNISEYAFEFNDLKEDVKYSLSKIVYGIDNNLTTEVSKDTKTDEFINPSESVVFIFNAGDNTKQIIGETSATLKLSYEDLNKDLSKKIIQSNSVIKVTYTNKTNQQSQEVNATLDTTNKEISISLTGLDANTQYELTKIVIDKAAEKDQEPTVDFTNNNLPKTFRTLNQRANSFESLSSAYDNARKEGTATVKMIVDRTNSLSNKSFKVVYTFDNAQEVESQAATIEVLNATTGEAKIEFVFPQTSLTSNRLYTFKELKNVTDNNTHAINNTTSNTFAATPGVTKATISTITSTETSVNLKLEISNPDQLELENSQVDLIYVRKGEDRDIDKSDISITKEGDKYFVTLSEANLTSNSEYELKSLRLKAKPAKANDNINSRTNNGIIIENKITWNTKSSSIAVNGISHTIASTRDKATINLLLSIKGTEFDNKKVKLFYEDAYGNAIQTNTLTLQNSQSSYQFELSIPNKDVNYKLKEIKYGDIDNSINQLVEKGTHSDTIAIPSKPIIFYYRPNEQTPFGENRADIKITFNDEDNVISQNSDIKVQWHPKSTLTTDFNQVAAQITLTPEKKIDISITGLTPNTLYEMGDISIQKAPNKDLVPTVSFVKRGDNKDFRTAAHRENSFKSVQVAFTQATRTTKASANLTIKLISDLEKSWKSNLFRVKYIDNNNEEVYTNEVQLANDFTMTNTGEVALPVMRLSNLTYNRRFTFAKLQRKATNGSWVDIDPIATTTGITAAAFSVIPGNTTSNINTSSVSEITTTSAKVNININDIDEAMDAGQGIIITVTPVNSALGNAKEVEGVVVVNNNQKTVEFTIEELLPNTDYKINQIRTKAKPTKAQINTNTTGIIYSNTTGITFKTIKEFAISKTAASKVNGDILFTLDIEGKPSDDKFKQVILKFNSHDGQVYYAIAKQDGTNNIFKYNPDKSSYTFKVDQTQVPANRNYTIDKAFIYDTSTGELANNNINETNNKFMEINFANNVAKNSAPIDVSKTEIRKNVIDRIGTNTAHIKLNLIDYILKGTNKIAHTSNYLNTTFTTGQQLLITLAPIQGATDSNTKEISANLQKTNPVPANGVDSAFWYVEFTANNLLNLTEYEIKKVRFATKPSVAYKNLNNSVDNIIFDASQIPGHDLKFTTLDTVPKISGLNATLPNQETRSFVANITLDFNNAKINGKKMRLVYRTANNSEIKSQILTIDTSNNRYAFNFNNLTPNVKYTSNRLEYANTDAELENTNTRSLFNNNGFISNNWLAAKVRVASANITSWNGNNANIIMTLEDPENVIDAGQRLSLTYDKVVGSVQIKTISDLTVETQGNQKVVNFSIPIEDLNTKYEIKTVTLNNKPSRSLSNNVGYQNSNKIYDKAIEDRLFQFDSSIKIKSFENITTDEENTSSKLKIKVLIANQGLDISNKYLRATVINELGQKINSQKISSSSISNNYATFLFDTSSEYQLNKLTPNRQITLEQIQMTDDEDNWNGKPIIEFENPNMDKTIVLKPSKTFINYFEANTKENNLSVVSLLIALQSGDKPFEENADVKFTFQNKADGSQVTKTVSINGVSTDKNGVNGIEFELNNLKGNSTYELVEVRLMQKPSVTFKNINSYLEENAENIIYNKNSFINNKADGINPLEFTTADFVPKIAANSQIIFTGDPYQQANKTRAKTRGADHLDAALSRHARILNITIPDYSPETRFYVEFIGKANVSLPPVANAEGHFNNGEEIVEKTHKVFAKNFVYDPSTKILTFDIEDLKAGYWYDFTNLRIEKDYVENNISKKQVYAYTPGDKNNTIDWKPQSDEMPEFEGIGYMIDSLVLSRNIKSHYIPDPSYSGRFNLTSKEKQSHLILVYENGWEAGDFGKLFNYLRMEVPQPRNNSHKYSYDGSKPSYLKEAWVERIKNTAIQLVRFLPGPRETSKTLIFKDGTRKVFPQISLIRSIQLGSKIEKDDSERFIHISDFRSRNKEIMNPILGGFDYNDYSSIPHKQDDSYKNSPYSNEIVNNPQESSRATWNFFKLSSGEEVLNKTLQYVLNRDRNKRYTETRREYNAWNEVLKD